MLIPNGDDWNELQTLNIEHLETRDDAWLLYSKQRLEAALKKIGGLADATPRWNKSEHGRMKVAFSTLSKKLRILNKALRERSVTVSLPLDES